MKKNIKGLSLTLVTNDACDKTLRSAMCGALVINSDAKTANFTESAPRKAKARNTKVWDGELLSMVVKSNGVFQIHTKTVNPLTVTDFAFRMYCEATALLQKAEGK